MSFLFCFFFGLLHFASFAHRGELHAKSEPPFCFFELARRCGAVAKTVKPKFSACDQDLSGKVKTSASVPVIVLVKLVNVCV